MPRKKPTGNMIKDTMDEYKQWNDWAKEGKREKKERAVKEYKKHLGGDKEIKVPKGGRVEIK